MNSLLAWKSQLVSQTGSEAAYHFGKFSGLDSIVNNDVCCNVEGL